MYNNPFQSPVNAFGQPDPWQMPQQQFDPVAEILAKQHAAQAVLAQQAQQRYHGAPRQYQSPADAWKQGLWASVPGSVAAHQANAAGTQNVADAPFSWNMDFGANNPHARTQYYLNRGAFPMPGHAANIGMPFVNAFNPDGSYNPNAPVQGRGPFAPSGGMRGPLPQAQSPLTGYQQGVPNPIFAQSQWPQLTGGFQF